jgi:serine/threonine protein kinase
MLRRMTPEQWAKANALFHEALDRPSEHRDAWLRTATAGDGELLTEVRALLAAHERDPAFLEEPLRLPGDAAARDEGAKSLAGRRIGPYNVTRELGRGGMGIVYLAFDTRLARDVAIKALPREQSADPHRRERLRREARAAAALAHTGIATVFALEEVWDEEERRSELYLVTEYVPGATLREELARGPLSPADWKDTAIELTRAIGAAHAQGVIHRDLKPENVIRTPGGAIKILDFGLARVLDEGAASRTAGAAATLSRSGVMLGTPAYMAPEQVRGEAVDARTDLFALGAMLYELACGQHPFEAPALGLTLHRLLNESPRPLTDVTPTVSPSVSDIVLRCLRKEPSARYASATALLDDLLRLDDPASWPATWPKLETPSWPPAGAGGSGPDARPLANAESAARPHAPPAASATSAMSAPAASPDDRIAGQAPQAAQGANAASADDVSPLAVSTESAPRPSQWWWWQFHQLAVSAFFAAASVPVWRAWDWIPAGLTRGSLRTALLAAVAGGVSLRLHLWFVSRHDPQGLADQRRRAAVWTRLADWGFTLTMMAGAAGLMGASPGTAALLLGLTVCHLVVFLMIEPATTRAAFRGR